MKTIQITGSQLRCGRTYAGLTIAEVAARSGVTRQAISAWEASSSAVPSARIETFARVVTVLESAGVDFLADGGVTRHRPATQLAVAAPAEAVAS
jgi:transcriptional regulator with XRE-family HTH domain